MALASDDLHQREVWLQPFYPATMFAYERHSQAGDGKVFAATDLRAKLLVVPSKDRRACGRQLHWFHPLEIVCASDYAPNHAVCALRRGRCNARRPSRPRVRAWCNPITSVSEPWVFQQGIQEADLARDDPRSERYCRRLPRGSQWGQDWDPDAACTRSDSAEHTRSPARCPGKQPSLVLGASLPVAEPRQERAPVKLLYAGTEQKQTAAAQEQ